VGDREAFLKANIQRDEKQIPQGKLHSKLPPREQKGVVECKWWVSPK
jgi:hypothetical protein